MITSLEIENLSIIRKACIRIGAGLSVITGETGAGKSILINAIGQLLGWKGKPLPVRKGASQASITLGADLDRASAARQWLHARHPGVASDEPGQRIRLRLIIPKNGRKKAFIDDASVSLAVLNTLAALLFDICGQNSQQALMQPKRHLDILDAQCGHRNDVERMADLSHRWHTVQRRLEQAHEQSRDMDSRRALLEYQIAELDELQPQEGEIERLEDEHRVLSQSEHLQQACRSVVSLIDDDDRGMQTELSKHLRELEAFDIERLGNITRQLEEAQIVLQSTASDLREFMHRIDLSPERLHEVGSRLSRFEEIARKHDTQTQTLHERHQTLRDELAALKDSGARQAGLERELEERRTQWVHLARRVGDTRRKTAARLERDVGEALEKLAMPDTIFQVRFEAAEPEQTPHPCGNERAYFYIRINPGSETALLSAVASGGETSRISLALNAAMEKNHPVPTLILDEIEAGVGGKTAETIGALLRNMSRKTQILCVTHLSQIAVHADHHHFIEKCATAKQTDVHLTTIERPQRDEEIARMIAGSITDKSLAHASELLDRRT